MVIETFHFDTHCEAKLTLFHKYGFVLWSLTNIFIVASDKQDVKKPYEQDVIITEKQDDIKPEIQDLQDSALQDSSQEPNQFEVILEVAILVSNQPIFWYRSSVIILHVFTPHMDPICMQQANLQNAPSNSSISFQNVVGIIGSGVLGALYATSQKEKTATKSTLASVCLSTCLHRFF